MNKPDRPMSAKRIRRWNCHKLECFADFINDYTKALANGVYYLELYANSGKCLCDRTDCYIDDSSLRALKSRFARHIFVTSDEQEVKSLKELAGARDRDRVEIISGNCNNVNTVRRLLDLIPRSASSLVFIDPPGYRVLHWKTIARLARHGMDWNGKKMDLVIIFPVEMALVRNLTRPECQASITRLYGNQQWLQIKQEKLNGEIGLDETRARLVKLFKSGLSSLGYKYVKDIKPTTFSKSPYYHLIWASDRGSGKILEEAWGKSRYLPCELLYEQTDSGQLS